MFRLKYVRMVNSIETTNLKGLLSVIARILKIVKIASNCFSVYRIRFTVKCSGSFLRHSVNFHFFFFFDF